MSLGVRKLPGLPYVSLQLDERKTNPDQHLNEKAFFESFQGKGNVYSLEMFEKPRPQF